jgi:hypothetical protein
MVAWHGVPGTAPLQKSRPVGYGLIASRRGHASRRGQVKCLARENNSSHSGPPESLFSVLSNRTVASFDLPFHSPDPAKVLHPEGGDIPKEGTGQK